MGDELDGALREMMANTVAIGGTATGLGAAHTTLGTGN